MTTAPTRRMWMAAYTIFMGGVIIGVVLMGAFVGVTAFIRLFACH